MDKSLKVTFPFNWDVPLELRRHVAEVPGQQRALEFEGHLLLVLHAVPSTGVWDREVRLYWRSPDGEWKFNEQGVGIQPLQRQVDDYSILVQEIEHEVEVARTAEQCYAVRKRLAPVHRAAHNQFAALLEAQQLCPIDEGLTICRNMAANVKRATELLTEDVHNTFEYAVAREAELQTRTTYRLSLLSATFFPILTFAVVFGMNIDSGLEHHTPILFWLMMCSGVGMGVYVKRSISDQVPETKPS